MMIQKSRASSMFVVWNMFMPMSMDMPPMLLISIAANLMGDATKMDDVVRCNGCEGLLPAREFFEDDERRNQVQIRRKCIYLDRTAYQQTSKSNKIG